MKKTIISLATILLFAISAFAQIAGQVVDAKGNAIANATVKAYGPDGPAKKVTPVTTDENGEYTFEELAPGKYSLAVIAKGFDVLIKDDVVVVADEDGPVTVDFKLAAAKPPATFQPPANLPPARRVPTMGSSGRFIRILNNIRSYVHLSWDVQGGSSGEWESPAGADPYDVTIPLPPNATNVALTGSTGLFKGFWYAEVLELEGQNRCYRAVPSPQVFDDVCTALVLSTTPAPKPSVDH